MLLAIDIGNSKVGAGVFFEHALVARWRLATERRRTADEYAAAFDSLFRLAAVDAAHIDGAIICSVVPPVYTSIREMLVLHRDIEPMTVTPELALGMELRYSPPASLGADRIANAVAAIDVYGSPVVVVDLGTATTIDAISRHGDFLGGAIAPGLRIAHEALLSTASQLAPVPLVPPPSAIGSTTAECIQVGALFGHAGLVDALVRRMWQHVGEDTRVVATGGLASLVAPLSETIHTVDAELTLVGLRLLYERNA